MINPFKSMDLYKAIILVSFVLIPAAGGFVYWVQDRLDVAEAALLNARKRGGEMEKIGQAQKQLETIAKSSQRGPGESHIVYFENRLLSSAQPESDFKSTDFQIGNEERRPVPRRRGQAGGAQDQDVKISFKREGKDRAYPRAFINAVLFNCESASKIWKLRELKIRNQKIKELGSSKEAPPKTVDDDWLIEKLVFSRREPAR